MRKLLVPLLAALSLPTAVNAESHWLIIQVATGHRWNALQKIEMESAEACDKEGKRWINSPTQESDESHRSFHCVVGK